MRPIRTDRGYPDTGASVQPEMINLGNAELESLPLTPQPEDITRIR